MFIGYSCRAKFSAPVKFSSLKDKIRITAFNFLLRDSASPRAKKYPVGRWQNFTDMVQNHLSKDYHREKK
jgi:hypothetical protein